MAIALACAAVAPARAQEGGGLSLDEVLRTTLSANADIRRATWEVERQGAGVRVAGGAFDPQVAAGLSSAADRSPLFGTENVPGIQSTNTVTYDVGVDQPFRSGLVVSPALSFSRLDAVGQSLGPRNQAVATLGLTMPLLRGRGGGMALAGERAAVMLHAASASELEFARSRALLGAVEAYWSYVAAHARLAVLRETEERSERNVQQTRMLVAADQRPAVDLLPLEANLASRRAARISGERGLITARQELGRAMGIPPAEVMRLAPPSTDFPSGPGAAGIAADSGIVSRALQLRPDLEAARRQHDAARDLLAGYRRETRPRLDLSVTLGYQGLEAGDEWGRYVSPFYSELGGMHTRLEVIYGMPLRNRLADGQARQGYAAEQQAALAYAELRRQVELDAAAALETLQRSAEELVLFDEAARLHALSLESEQRRYQLGTSTIFDIINAEEGLTSATLSEIEARRTYAVSLARLRHETGMLLPGGAPDARALTGG
ncbi:TolC family protein [Longimicrobium sp.]|uniref:TolC family protein n=1 Tax=Longimicrobium sp. TaxID=2029185 RepID=UPI002E3127B4|nr:TolC family protein [Longimicrobium sp.]HEX6041345.1 TolC family protein [Longimicrobium sp.]